MEGSVDLVEVLVVYLRIDLRGADIRMAQKFLNDAQIGPPLQQVCRKCVSQGMG